MSYIGVQPTAGQYRKLDDISGSFNGSTTTFTTQVGSQNVSAGTAQQLLVSLGGVIQNPITDYTVSTNSITFTTAPAAGLSFFAVLMGEAVNTGTPSDGVVTGAKLSAPFNYNSGLLYLDSSNNRVGIGTTSAGGKLHVSSGSSSALVSADADELIVENSGNCGITLASPNSGTCSIRFADPQNNDSGSISYNHNDETLRFATFSTERARFDSSGRWLLGTSSAPTGTNSQYSKHVIQGNTFDGSGSARMAMRVGVGASSLSSGSGIADIYFVDSGAGEYARIGCEADAQAGTNDYPGRLVFSTTADGAASPTERARITAGGYFKASPNTVYNSATGPYHEFANNTTVDPAVIVRINNASYADYAFTVGCYRSANSAYSLAQFLSGDGSTNPFTDREFNLRGDGQAYADGSWNGGGADYAEYFEWSDSNPDEEDRRGISVVLDGNKIREAVAGEDPIGVISGNPSVVGDAAWNKWSGKYLRDDFGTYIQEDYEVINDEGETVVQQRRKLNPAYDPDVEYIPREQRPEWDCVGLMGKLRIRKGQVTGSRWIKMRDISDTVEEWLVR